MQDKKITVSVKLTPDQVKKLDNLRQNFKKPHAKKFTTCSRPEFLRHLLNIKKGEKRLYYKKEELENLGYILTLYNFTKPKNENALNQAGYYVYFDDIEQPENERIKKELLDSLK